MLEKHAFKVNCAAIETNKEAFNFSFFVIEAHIAFTFLYFGEKIMHNTRLYPSDLLSEKGNTQLPCSRHSRVKRSKVKRDCNNIWSGFICSSVTDDAVR